MGAFPVRWLGSNAATLVGSALLVVVILTDGAGVHFVIDGEPLITGLTVLGSAWKVTYLFHG